MISNIQNGEVEFQTTEIQNKPSELKSAIPIEISNINPDNKNVLSMGLDKNVVMSILTNNIYKDKLICLQEITSNGRDGIIKRIESGDTNFSPEIHINIYMKNKEITFHDNGSGMTKSLVNEVYRIFGRSDKRDSITQVGMFGIGSKSPFSLVDEYSVTTVSMLTHKKLEFIVTKRAILITKDEELTDEEPGTTVKFSLPDNNSFNTYEQKLKDVVKSWICPVYVSGISDNGYVYDKHLISHGLKDMPITKCTEGFYDFDNAAIKYICDDYAFLATNDKSRIYVGHIPYDVNLNFGLHLNIIIKNPNLVTLTATRESLEKDSKYDELIKNVTERLRELLLPEFDKYFKNLPETIKNSDKPINIWDNNIFYVYEAMNKLNMVTSEYPYFKLLQEYYEYYTNIKDRSQLSYILNKRYPVYYTNKKLNSTQREIAINSIRKEGYNPAIIYLPDICTKFCLFCHEYNLNNRCSADKVTYDAITDIIPKLPEFKAPKRAYAQKKNFKAYSLASHKDVKINANFIQDYIYTTESFNTNNQHIIKVPHKKLQQLKEAGCKVIDNIDEYKNDIITNTFVRTIDEVEISAALFKNYKYIFHNAHFSDYEMQIIKLLFPEDKTLILKDSIPDDVLLNYKASKNQRILSNYDLEGYLGSIEGELSLNINVPIYKILSFLRAIDNKNSGIIKIKKLHKAGKNMDK